MRCLWGIGLLFVWGSAVAALQITQVRHAPQRIDPAHGERMTVQFSLSERAVCTMNIYDGRELLIRRIDSDTELKSGEHSMQWDGKDQNGKRVPPEAYHYTLVAKEIASGQVADYDVTDWAGEALTVVEVKWNAKTHKFSYVLPQAARVRIRVGLANEGPLLNTVIDWVARPAGLNTQAWNGKDVSGELDLTHHPKLIIVAEAFSLSTNTVLVGRDADKMQLIEPTPTPGIKRALQKPPQRKMFVFSQQPIEQRRDFVAEITLPDGLGSTAQGVPIVTGQVPVHIDVKNEDRDWVLANRLESVFFLDGQFRFETEKGYLPLTWVWDSSPIPDGIHYLTVNLRGYEGNFGIATKKVYVRSSGSIKQDTHLGAQK